MPPGVSFVITVYNKAPYLPALIDSLAGQRGAFAREFIFIDDGSKDDSLQVLAALTPKLGPDVRIEAFSNGGQAVATNRGLTRAHLEFVKPIDADDLIHPDFTETLLDALSADPGAAMALTRLAKFRDDSVPDLSAPAPIDGPATPMPDPTAQLLRNSIFNPTQLLIRNSAIRACGGCDERVRNSMEHALGLRLSRQGRFVEVPTTMAHQRIGMADSLSANEGVTLAEVTAACGHFLAEYPDTAPPLKALAVRRAAGRAWRWQARKHGAPLWSRWSLARIKARLPLADPAGFILEMATAFTPAPLPRSAR